MQNLIFSLNATLPVFLTMVAGWLLRQWGFLPKEFCKAADRLTFKITLPIMLFLDMSAVDILHDFQPKFVLFCFAATLAGILVIWGAAHVLIRDKSIVGSCRPATAAVRLCWVWRSSRTSTARRAWPR